MVIAQVNFSKLVMTNFKFAIAILAQQFDCVSFKYLKLKFTYFFLFYEKNKGQRQNYINGNQKVFRRANSWMLMIVVTEILFQFKEQYNKITAMFVLTKTLKKKPHQTIKKVRSYDDLNKTTELSLQDIKILLCCNHHENEKQQLTHRIQKQEVLERNRLIDPLKLFGLNNTQSVFHSARSNSTKLESMFESTNGSKSNSCCKKGTKKETLILGKTLNSYLRENKQNYQRNGVNNIQKMRVKLKLCKKIA